MLSEEIVKALHPKKIINESRFEINGISYNSKTVKKGDIFVCLKGEHTDGHDYVLSAEQNGAVAFLCEQELSNIKRTQLIVEDTKVAIADLAEAFFKSPSNALKLVGVTGTNGKTTVTHLIQKIVEANNQKCAVIGTLGHKLSSNGEYLDAKHTTPQAVELQATLRKIADNEINTVAMEVSSHALEQNRTRGCDFNGAVFTNLTQDHLDYHITMKNYFEAKAILFKNLKEGSFAVVNADDAAAKQLIAETPNGVKIMTYGIKNKADVMAKDITFTLEGADFQCSTPDDTLFVKMEMNGLFSVYNVLAAISAGLCLNIKLETCVSAIQTTTGVAGRFETVHKKPLIIVDYAHTPDGLENVLKAAKELVPPNADLICLFGCGGDRDATKRPKMGKIAYDLADKVIITSDNPRSEDPNLIISDIMTGIQKINSEKLFVEPDRRLAISLIKKITNSNDVVVVAGKGHENYQILKDETIHFDDKEEVQKLYQ